MQLSSENKGIKTIFNIPIKYISERMTFETQLFIKWKKSYFSVIELTLKACSMAPKIVIPLEIHNII